jgi:hypothetical protein
LAFRSGREADHSPPSSAEVKEGVELYLHSPNTPSWRSAQLGGAQGQVYIQNERHFGFSFVVRLGSVVVPDMTRPVASLLIPGEVCGLWESEQHVLLPRPIPTASGERGLRANNAVVRARRHFLQSIMSKQNTNLNNPENIPRTRK